MTNTLKPTRNNGTGLPGWTSIDKEFDRMFDELFKPLATSRSTKQNTHITEHDDRYEWSVDMPGLSREDIDVKFDGDSGLLEVSTSYEDVSRRRDYRYSARLGNSVDTEDISAEYDSGVLTVTLPKRDRDENVHEIEIT